MVKKKLDPVTQYAQDVVDGKILAGKLLVIAARRHLKDLKRQGTKKFPFHFDTDMLKQFLFFAQHVPDPDTGVPQPLMAWQIFVLGSIIAWRNDKTGGKRFRRGITSIARSQGKTYLAGILVAYDFFVQSFVRNNQDIIASANTTDQTKKLFNYITATVESMLDEENGIFRALRKKITPRFMDIINKPQHNQIVRISAEGGKYDGYHAATAIFDEAGDQKNRDAFGKITSGQIKLEEAFFWMISTAYQNPNAPLREDIKSVSEAIEKGDDTVNDVFLAVWSQDDPNEVFDPDTWIKSNPLLGLESQYDKLMTGLVSERDSKMREGKINDFLVKNMNVWLNAEQDAAFELDDIERSVKSDFDIHGRKVYIGFDNSMTSDDAAVAFVFPYRDEEDNQRWHLMQHSFIPWHKAKSIEAKENQDGINYRQMEELGVADITKHEKGLISNDFIFTWITEFVRDNELEVIYFAYDAAHTYAIIKAIEEATTWTMLPVRQGAWTLNEPTKWLQDAFIEGRVTREEDPMMEKSLVNAVIVHDGNNGIKIDKNKETYKIDLVDALIDALVEGINHFEDFAQSDDENEYDRMSENQLADFLKSGEFGF